MANNYLIENTNSIILKATIKNIINKEKFNDAVINYYNLDDVLLSSALDDLDTYGLFNDKKVIVINNIDNFSIESNKDDYNHLISYLDNPSSNNLLIITANKLNNTKKLTKELKKKMIYKEIDSNSIDYIKKELNGYKLDSGVIRLINDYCNEDFDRIHTECQKLISYKDTDNVITKEDIDKLLIKSSKDITELTFEFTKYLFNKDKYNALLLFNELKENGVEPISLIGLMASQIRIIYQVKILVNRKLNNLEISKILDEKEYRIKKTRELINYYSEEELLELIRKLSDMDINIKTTDIDSEFLIELFIINLKK